MAEQQQSKLRNYVNNLVSRPLFIGWLGMVCGIIGTLSIQWIMLNYVVPSPVASSSNSRCDKEIICAKEDRQKKQSEKNSESLDDCLVQKSAESEKSLFYEIKPQIKSGVKSSSKPGNAVEQIYSIALKDIGKTSYSKKVARDGFGVGAPKCNLYIHDVLERAGLNAPEYAQDSNGKAWPIVSAAWVNPKYNIPGWKVVDNPKPGDVCAVKFKNSKNATGHVGFVVGNDYSVSARSNAVVKDRFCFEGKYKGKCTFRRYHGRNR